MKTITMVILLIISTTTLSAPVGSRFSYQGQLQFNDVSVTGTYDFKVELWNQAIGGSFFGSALEIADVEVVDGVFTMELDFTDAPFTGDDWFLKIQVREGASTGGYITMSPKQRINATPYAIQADFLAANGATTGQVLKFDGSNWVAGNDNSGSPYWSENFGGVQYIGDVVIGELVASAGDTLQVLSQVDESPLRLLVGGLGTRFRVSKNGGTGIGANYNDGQIPDNGLRVAGNVQLGKTSIGSSPDLAPGNGLNVEGSVLAKSNMKVYGNLAIGSADFSGSTALQINSGAGDSPLRIKINNATKMRIYDNGGTSLGGNAIPEVNGLVVQGNVLARSDVNVDGKMQVTGDSNVAVSTLTLDGGSPLKANVNGLTKLLVAGNGGTFIGGGSGGLAQLPTDGLYVAGDVKLNSDLTLVGKPKQDINSHGFAKAGIKLLCGFSAVTNLQSFNNVNAGVLLVTHSVPNYIGQCTITFPFDISNSFIQTDVDPTANLFFRKAICRQKTGSTTQLSCRIGDPDGSSTDSIMSLLVF